MEGIFTIDALLADVMFSASSKLLSLFGGASHFEYAFPFETVSPRSFVQVLPLTTCSLLIAKKEALTANCTPVVPTNCAVVCTTVSSATPLKTGCGAGPCGVTRKLTPGAL